MAGRSDFTYHPCQSPLWLTWWAKLIYILVSISIIYLILHAYKKKLDLESLYTLEKKNHEQEQELNQERLRFYTNITHELRTPLTLILGPLEDMQKRPHFRQNKPRSYLSSIRVHYGCST